MSIRLHIDRLVLDGVNVRAADRPRLQAAIESELARLIASGGISPELARGIAVPSVRAPRISLANDVEQLGESIAGSVYGGVGSRNAGVPPAGRAASSPPAPGVAARDTAGGAK